MRKKAKLRLKAYSIVSEAVENGVRLGLSRSRKHTDTPSQEHVEESVARSVIELMSEVVDWERSG